MGLVKFNNKAPNRHEFKKVMKEHNMTMDIFYTLNFIENPWRCEGDYSQRYPRCEQLFYVALSTRGGRLNVKGVCVSYDFTLRLLKLGFSIVKNCNRIAVYFVGVINFK